MGNYHLEKGDTWSIQSIKYNLEKQRINLDMITSEKRCILPMLFDSMPIENNIFSLLHAEIGISNYIIDSFYSWITKYIEPLSNEEFKF